MLRTKILASVLAAGCLLLGGCLQTSDTGTEKELETAVTTQTVPSATAPAALTAVQQVERVRQAMALNYFQDDIRQMTETESRVYQDGKEIILRQTSDTRILMLHTSPMLLTDTETFYLGETTAQSYYYADGMFYWKSGDIRLRQPAEWDTVFQMGEGIPADVVTSAEEEETEEGTRITFQLDSARCGDWILQQAKGNENANPLDGLKIKEARLVAELSKEGYLLSQQTEVVLTREEAGEEAYSQTETVTVTYPDVGRPVELVPPEGLDQYTLVDGENIPDLVL